jgi:hypothetical protein
MIVLDEQLQGYVAIVQVVVPDNLMCAVCKGFSTEHIVE